MTRFLAIAAAVIVIAGAGGLWLSGWWSAPSDQFADCRSGQVAGGIGQIGGPFELVNSKGQTVTDKDVLKGPSLVYFGYTFCPDVCPLDNARNAEAVDILAERGKIVTPVFISIDPKRDTPEVVGDYADSFGAGMIGLTGSPEQVHAASKAYKTYYQAQPAEDEFYVVDHSTFTYLTLPGHGVVEFFRRNMEASEMADKVACFIDNS